MSKTVEISMQAVCLCLSEENRERIQAISNGNPFGKRECEAAQYVAPLLGFSHFKGDKDMEGMCRGFILGYIMRGLDNILDFNLTEDEILESVLDTCLTWRGETPDDYYRREMGEDE